ncbi:nuclear pore complex component [Colletotrichum paranaense]|uniref:Nuclear pore complex component n=1 Tax=Colletotrichum paranaense TaxID=1914294 RepID=A0ABQ9SLG0_9PEZI|nr:nuclear pore complex component [Colletotrichum paranaense]KAK1538440.1 nuclear pore complex component [Colletotrichum paranaense]
MSRLHFSVSSGSLVKAAPGRERTRVIRSGCVRHFDKLYFAILRGPLHPEVSCERYGPQLLLRNGKSKPHAPLRRSAGIHFATDYSLPVAVVRVAGVLFFCHCFARCCSQCFLPHPSPSTTRLEAAHRSTRALGDSAASQRLFTNIKQVCQITGKSFDLDCGHRTTTSIPRSHLSVLSIFAKTMSSSASRAAISTPVKSTPQKPTPIVDSPGTWRHPRLNEITRRRNATTFSEKNVRRIALNVGFLLSLWLSQIFSRSYVPAQWFSSSLRSYLGWAYYLVQLIPLVNIGMAMLPLLRSADDLSDIPLTPAQRQLLGLPPSSAAATPDAVYSTPPRYSRTPSLAGSPASNRSFSGSPLSGRGSPALGSSFNGNGQSYSPSPLHNSPSKFSASLNSNRRSSFGSSTNLAASTASSLFPDPGTPSPSTGKRTSVGLNNKWLYERGRRSSGGTWMH